jgi:tetratricopeptide (TPR) repeat protein
MYHYWNNTEEDYEKASEYFQQSIDVDPAYALAHMGLADYYNGSVIDGFMSPQEGWPKSVAALRKVLQIDPKLSLAHRGMGWYQFTFNWDWAAAEREFKTALNLDPKEPRLYRGYSWLLLATNRINEAIKQMKIANELDPLSRVFSVNYGQFLMTAGRYDEAIEQLNKTIRSDPKYAVSRFSIAQVYEQKKMYKEAIAEMREGYVLQGNDDAANLFTDVEDEVGYKEAREIIARANLEGLNEMVKEKYVSPIEFARLHAQLNEKDEAFQWLEKAFNERSAQLVYLKVLKDWDNLRSDPRFAELVKRIGLP